MARWDYLPPHLESRVIDTFSVKKAVLENQTNKKSKYSNKKVILDNHTFDSQKEAEYYQKLCLLKMAGEITEIELQPKFELQPSFKHNGKTIRAITYIADFKITEKNGHIYFVDVKGFKTKDYVLKKKMLLYRYPSIDFREIGVDGFKNELHKFQNHITKSL